MPMTLTECFDDNLIQDIEMANECYQVKRYL